MVEVTWKIENKFKKERKSARKSVKNNNSLVLIWFRIVIDLISSRRPPFCGLIGFYCCFDKFSPVCDLICQFKPNKQKQCEIVCHAGPG